MTHRVFGVTGWKNSGKTALTVRLVAAFAERGLKVATVKHAHHSFDIDQPGTDSFRHRQAGAMETVIVSSRRWAQMHELATGEQEPSLATVLARISPCDLVLVEGYKNEAHPKIECRRKEARDQTPLAGSLPGIVAIASDGADPQDAGLPFFFLDDIPSIAGFILSHLGME